LDRDYLSTQHLFVSLTGTRCASLVLVTVFAGTQLMAVVFAAYVPNNSQMSAIFGKKQAKQTGAEKTEEEVASLSEVVVGSCGFLGCGLA
jgi:hypothetical protein